MIPYEYGAPQGDGSFDWLLSDWLLEDRERRALVMMLVRLFRTDPGQAVGSVIFKEAEPGIYYAKAAGNVQLRPRLCRGPRRPNDEVTFLVRATERGSRTIPPDAAQMAAVLLHRVRAGTASCRRYRPMPPTKPVR